MQKCWLWSSDKSHDCGLKHIRKHTTISMCTRIVHSSNVTSTEHSAALQPFKEEARGLQWAAEHSWMSEKPGLKERRERWWEEVFQNKSAVSDVRGQGHGSQRRRYSLSSFERLISMAQQPSSRHTAAQERRLLLSIWLFLCYCSFCWHHYVLFLCLDMDKYLTIQY